MQQEPGKTKDKYFRSLHIMTNSCPMEKTTGTHVLSSETPLQPVLQTLACTIIRLYLNTAKTGSAVNHPPNLFFTQLLEIKSEMYSCCDRFSLQTLFPDYQEGGEH